MEEKTKFCIHCGKKIPATASFCGYTQGSDTNAQKNVDQTSNYQQTVSPNSFTSNISDVPYNENEIPGIVSSTKLYFKDMFRINK